MEGLVTDSRKELVRPKGKKKFGQNLFIGENLENSRENDDLVFAQSCTIKGP